MTWRCQTCHLPCDYPARRCVDCEEQLEALLGDKEDEDE